MKFSAGSNWCSTTTSSDEILFFSDQNSTIKCDEFNEQTKPNNAEVICEHNYTARVGSLNSELNTEISHHPWSHIDTALVKKPNSAKEAQGNMWKINERHNKPAALPVDTGEYLSETSCLMSLSERSCSKRTYQVMACDTSSNLDKRCQHSPPQELHGVTDGTSRFFAKKLAKLQRLRFGNAIIV